MAVYVDVAQHKYRGMIMCHMVADSLEELHAMADQLGLRRSWFQEKSSFPHYDISKGVRARAVILGAQEVTRQELYAVMVRFRESWGRTHGLAR